MIGRSPPSTRSPAARTTKVVLPAPGGESTTTALWSARARSARTAAVVASAAAVVSESGSKPALLSGVVLGSIAPFLCGGVIGCCGVRGFGVRCVGSGAVRPRDLIGLREHRYLAPAGVR